MIDDSEKILCNLKPGWVARPVKNKTQNYYKILDFYIVNSICDSISCKGKTIREIGWDKDVWKKGFLRKEVLGLICDENSLGEHFFSAKTNAEIRKGINKLNLNKNFHMLREERIVIYKKYNLTQIESIFYHIRNALAHGRFQIYTNETDETYYVFESGIIKKSIEKIDLKARMILKESTLLKWIDIINKPVKQIEK